MKIKTTILMASIFAASTAMAQPMTPNEIFSAIDGEYNHIADDSPRENYDLSSPTSNRTLDHILSGVDGLYDASASRVNYSDNSQILNYVLSGIDGEYTR